MKNLFPRILIPLVIIGALSQTGCCWMFPCDRGFRVEGQVVDSTGQPVSGVAVVVFGRSEGASPDGSFSVSGIFAAPTFPFRVEALGYRSYEAEQPMGSWKVRVILVAEGASGESTGAWTTTSGPRR